MKFTRVVGRGLVPKNAYAYRAISLGCSSSPRRSSPRNSRVRRSRRRVYLVIVHRPEWRVWRVASGSSRGASALSGDRRRTRHARRLASAAPRKRIVMCVEMDVSRGGTPYATKSMECSVAVAMAASRRGVRESLRWRVGSRRSSGAARRRRDEVGQGAATGRAQSRQSLAARAASSVAAHSEASARSGTFCTRACGGCCAGCTAGISSGRNSRTRARLPRSSTGTLGNASQSGRACQRARLLAAPTQH